MIDQACSIVVCEEARGRGKVLPYRRSDYFERTAGVAQHVDLRAIAWVIELMARVRERGRTREDLLGPPAAAASPAASFVLHQKSLRKRAALLILAVTPLGPRLAGAAGRPAARGRPRSPRGKFLVSRPLQGRESLSEIPCVECDGVQGGRARRL